jgi:hypothetical protein
MMIISRFTHRHSGRREAAIRNPVTFSGQCLALVVTGFRVRSLTLAPRNDGGEC